MRGSLRWVLNNDFDLQISENQPKPLAEPAKVKEAKEASLVLEIVHAQCDVHCVEKMLAECVIWEHKKKHKPALLQSQADAGLHPSFGSQYHVDQCNFQKSWSKPAKHLIIYYSLNTTNRW